MSDIERNDSFDLAFRFVTETQESVFLTGRAGTGKTTFLKYLHDHCTKNMLVAAPTGVAAINAGGVTLHSLFQLPLQPFLPTIGGRQQLLNGIRFNRQRLALLRKMQLLVIDEISMVRCDVLDAIDAILRSVRQQHNTPFGGVQLLLIGDLYQLPPVARTEDWQLLGSYYGSPFFFDSLCIREQLPLMIELTTIYRQKDDHFVSLLNKVRNNLLSPLDFEQLNQRFQRDFKPDASAAWITLTSHNYQADAINQLALQQLTGKPFTYSARIEDEFPENIYPADASLVLKEGAQVMFIKNDVVTKKYFNGKIGRVLTLEEDRIVVECEGAQIEVPEVCWENTRYTLNRTDEKLEQQVIGKFYQYPLRLAWGITIHKSQGLTFDRVMIDAAASFSSGQVYVALSRCTSLEGIVLLNKIPPAAITTNEHVNNAQEGLTPRGSLAERFRGARQVFTAQLLHRVFTLEEVQPLINWLKKLVQQYSERITAQGTVWMHDFDQLAIAHQTVAEKFLLQVQQLLQEEPLVENNPILQQRIKDAAAYFMPSVQQMKEKLTQHSLESEYLEAATALDECLQELQTTLWRIGAQMEYCRQDFSVTGFLRYQLNLPVQKIKITSYAAFRKPSSLPNVAHPELYLKLRQWRDDLCQQHDTPLYMVASNSNLRSLCESLPINKSELMEVPGFGKGKTFKYGDEILDIIQDYCAINQVEKNLNTTVKAGTRKKKAPAGGHDKTGKIPSSRISLDLYLQGQSVEDIAQHRNLARSTVEGHIVECIGKGELPIERYVTADTIAYLGSQLQQHADKTLKELVMLLEEQYSYSQIRAVQHHLQRLQEG